MAMTSITAALRLNAATLLLIITTDSGDNVPFGKDYEMVSQAVS